jgi:hypothetical protein
MHGILSHASGDVTSAGAATITGKSSLCPSPHRCDVAAIPTVKEHATPLLTQTTGNRHRYKKPVEQHMELVCEEEPLKRVNSERGKMNQTSC